MQSFHPLKLARRDSPTQRVARAAALCAGCALVYLAAELLLGRGMRLCLTLWRTGAGASASAAQLETVHWAATLAVGWAALILPVAVVCGGLEVTPRRLLLCAPKRRGAVRALVLYLGAAELLNLAAAFVGRTTGSEQSITLPAAPAARVLAFLAVCVVPPVFEELLFRGAARALLRPYGAWLAVIGQGVLFAALHGSLAGMVLALPAGVAFGYLAEWTGSLYPGMLLHAVNNTMAFVLLLFHAEGMETQAAALSAGMLVACPVLAAAVVYDELRHRRHTFGPLPAGASPRLLLKSPFWVAAVILLVADVVRSAAG